MEALHPEDPAEIGPYRLRARLGAGGMGVVYFGFSTDGHRRAIKVPHRDLAADAEFRRRFAAEVAAASKVAGPGVATVVAADTDADLPWLASEYVPGSPLGESADVPMGTDDARAFAFGLAVALADIHAAGVVHRDLKPANILLTDTGPRVVDFGIATSGFTRLTSTGVIIGSPGWIAPERLKGDDATSASDVWAWGACVAYAFTGRPPFGGDTPDVIAMRILLGQPDLAALPDAPASIVARALSVDPDQRPSARDLANHLRKHQGPPPAAVVAVPTPNAVARDVPQTSLVYDPVNRSAFENQASRRSRRRSTNLDVERTPAADLHQPQLLAVAAVAAVALAIVMGTLWIAVNEPRWIIGIFSPDRGDLTSSEQANDREAARDRASKARRTAKPAPTSRESAYESEVVRLTNDARADAGCGPLRTDSRLREAARAHSVDMAARGYFDHSSPDGKSAWDRMGAVGYTAPAGENIARGYESAEAVVQGWLDSPWTSAQHPRLREQGHRCRHLLR